MDAVTRLIRWDVPFAEARYPSVGVITECGGDVTTLVVAPKGIDNYPKFLARFEKVLALLSYEEACALDRGYSALPGFDPECCAYRWIESPWLESYRKGADVFAWKDLRHFLILGGDSIVEVIASGQPKVERLDKRAIMETKHEI
jgi:hypothetical protein